MHRKDFQRLCWDYQQKLIERTNITDEATEIGDAEQSLEEVLSEEAAVGVGDEARVERARLIPLGEDKPRPPG